MVIYRHKEKYSISEMCRFFDVSRSGYYGYMSRMDVPSKDLPLAEKIKGRPPKDYIVTEQDKVTELKYILARKDAKIKSLEMENELMRDFLSLTERK